MSSKKSTKPSEEKKIGIGRKGSYILEGSLVIPPLILVMVLLISAVSLIASGEKALFVMGEELKLAGIKAAFLEEPVTTPIAVKMRIAEDSNLVDEVGISEYGYLYDSHGIQDLISLGISLKHSGLNPLGKMSLLKIEQRVIARAFTGLNREGDHGENALTGHETSEIVYIFPKRGEKYHKRNCPFLNPACQKVFLTADVKRRFKACTNCKSGSAKVGDVVFCFFTDGKVYHLGSCSQVDKYYVEIEKKDAESRGYSPCGTCGG